VLHPSRSARINQVTFTNPITQAVAMELANDEQEHVAPIQGALASLGVPAIAKPAINLAALGIGFSSQTSLSHPRSRI
jgi:hypothetical protein